MRAPPPLSLGAADTEALRVQISDDATGTSAAARRAYIVLLSADGCGPSAVADLLGCSRQTVVTWRERYRRGGVAALLDAPRSGRPVTVRASTVINRTLQAPPDELPAARWSTRSLADDLGISNAAVAQVWKAWGITPLTRGRVQLDTHPALVSPVVAVAGLHIDPSVRLCALWLGAPGHERGLAQAVEERPGLGNRLSQVAPRSDAATTETADPRRFLRRLIGPAVLGEGTPQNLGLIVEAGAAVPRGWADELGIRSYAVPPSLSWQRTVRVLCILAGESTAGGASVRSLRRAIDALAAEQGLSWIAADHGAR